MANFLSDFGDMDFEDYKSMEATVCQDKRNIVQKPRRSLSLDPPSRPKRSSKTRSLPQNHRKTLPKSNKPKIDARDSLESLLVDSKVTEIFAEALTDYAKAIQGVSDFASERLNGVDPSDITRK
eukprot:92348_1